MTDTTSTSRTETHPCRTCGTPTVATCIPGRDDDDAGNWYRWCVDGCGRTVAYTPATVTR